MRRKFMGTPDVDSGAFSHISPVTPEQASSWLEATRARTGYRPWDGPTHLAMWVSVGPLEVSRPIRSFAPTDLEMLRAQLCTELIDRCAVA
jgi:hypothetical protein